MFLSSQKTSILDKTTKAMSKGAMDHQTFRKIRVVLSFKTKNFLDVTR
jgi:hypothetical protein